MCCIFTCCGWMVDLIQRLWTFTMSCCISSAVCCSLVTASMSGVALGYNYSLAEYIELKETNVSVYLKRGVFDDEISDDMDWRRSGHLPVAGHIGESNLMTGASDEATTLRSGRRLDDSIYESNDRSNFEGSLMRLTAKPLETASTFPPSEKSLDDVLRQYTMGSLDQLKAVQGVLNQKKAEAAATRRVSNKKQDDQIIVPEKRPMFPYPESYGRRAMLYTVPTIEPRSTYGSLRSAVPDDQINDLTKWRLPKLPPQSIPFDMQYVDSYMSPTYPSPVTPLPGPAKPTRPIEFARARSRPTRPTPTHTKISAVKHSKGPEIELPKSIDEDMEAFKKKLMEDKFVPPMLTDEDFLKKIDVGKIKANEDYEEDIKGIPLRKKRNIVVTTPKNSFDNKNKATIKDTKQIVETSTKLGVTVGRVTHGGKTDAGSKDNENLGFAKTAAPTLATSEKSPTNMIIKLLSSTIS